MDEVRREVRDFLADGADNFFDSMLKYELKSEKNKER